MDLILEFVSHEPSEDKEEVDASNLIHMSALLLHEAPQGKRVF
jgi:hypothetical protein